MKLTVQQKSAVTCEASTLLEACPGSGKTRTLIAKAIRCLRETRSTTRKIACITYTNAAAFEISSRLRARGTGNAADSCEISTIHSFCLNNLLRPFTSHLREDIRSLNVLPPDTEEYARIVEECIDEYGLPRNSRETFPLLGRKPDGSAILVHPVNKRVASAFWNKMYRAGYVDFPNIVYLAYKLLEENPSIARTLSCCYAWILVDEFQDTSALQVEIFRCIHEQGRTRFFLVGDSCQSIFSFAGARPDLMRKFAAQIEADGSHTLASNFRSSRRIIRHADRIICRGEPMQAAGVDADFAEEPLWIDADDTPTALVDEFFARAEVLGIEQGECAVLAPTWYSLFNIAASLREAGIRIVGPGARPYKRMHLFGPFAEQVCAYLDEPTAGRRFRVEHELHDLVRGVTGEPNTRVRSYGGRIALARILRRAREFSQLISSTGDWLRAVARETGDLLREAGILSASAVPLLAQSVCDIIEDMETRRVDVSSLSLEQLGMLASGKKSAKLLTMHRAKGSEFDAVAIIDLHDGLIPHRSCVGDSNKMEEASRVFYVAVTRARKLLVYVTRLCGGREPSCFLGEGYLGLGCELE